LESRTNNHIVCIQCSDPSRHLGVADMPVSQYHQCWCQTIGFLAKRIREIWKLVCHFFIFLFTYTHTYTCKPSACFPSQSSSPWPGRSFPATPLWQHPSSKTRPSGPRFLLALLKPRSSMEDWSRNGTTLRNTAYPSLPTFMAAIIKADTTTSLPVLHTCHNQMSISHTAKLTKFRRMLA